MNRYGVLLASACLAACGFQPSSPLARAVWEGNNAKVRAILANAAASHADLQEALITAARSGNAAAIPELQFRGADLEEPSGVNEWPPLKHAIHKDRLASVRALLAAGADPDSLAGGGETPLMMAAGYGYTPILQELLRRGADPRRAGRDGTTALDAALTGSSDIDRFTYGTCQTETVRVLLAAAPDIRPHRNNLHCPEIARLLAGAAGRK